MKSPALSPRDAQNFRSWLKDPAPLPMDPELAKSLALLGRRDLLRELVRFGENFDPAATLGAARRWAEAIAKHGIVPRRDAEPWDGRADILERWVGAWAGLEAEAARHASLGYDSMGSIAKKWLQGWRELAGEIGPAAEALERALGWRSPSLPERAFAGVERAMNFDRSGREAAMRDMEMSLWMSLGARAASPAAWDAKLASLVGKEGSWRAAALLARAGAKAAPGMEGQMRHWINSALAEGGGKMNSVSAKERVARAQDLLAATGTTIAGYRSKAGGRFDAMAVGAIWSWPDGDLAEELCLAGMSWSASTREKAPLLAARHVAASYSAPQARQAALRGLDAMCGSEGFGPYGLAWGKLASELKGAIRHSEDWREWGEGFGRWGRASGWDASAWSSIESFWPALSGSEAFKAGAEAAQLRAAANGATCESVSEAEAKRPRL